MLTEGVYTHHQRSLFFPLLHAQMFLAVILFPPLPLTKADKLSIQAALSLHISMQHSTPPN
jgi:hypothetical protein